MLSLALAFVFLVRFLQNPNPADLTMFGALLLVALPGVASLFATFAYDGVKTIFPFYAKLDPRVHMIVSPIASFLFGFFVVGKLHLPGVTAVAGLNLEWFMGGATMLGTAGIFRFFKRSKPVDASVPVEAGRATVGE